MVAGSLLSGSPLLAVVVIVVATALIWVGSGLLEESAEHLAAFYGLPAVVQGSVVVAVGSSFPELASVVVTALADTFEMGVGAIVGSAIFNILVIPSLSGLFARGDLEANRTIVYKEAQFYMLAVSTIVITFALAVIYVPADTAQPLVGVLTRPLALLPLLVYCLYLWIQWQDVSDHDAPDAPSDIRIVREWGRLALGLLIILVAVEGLVGGVETIGATFGIPAFLSGLTIIAAATSLPDLLVSVRTARAQQAETSLGNVLGSNTFDLLVAIPIGVLIVGHAPVDFAAAVPMLAVLTLATVLLFALLRTDLSLTDREAYGLLAAYVLFLAWVISETLGLTTVLHTA